LAACEPECIAFPGADVEPGFYHIEMPFELRRPVGGIIAEVPYADVEDFTIELVPDRSRAIFRYRRNGVVVEEIWSTRILN
jgi:hypothetical protein